MSVYLDYYAVYYHIIICSDNNQAPMNSEAVSKALLFSASDIQNELTISNIQNGLTTISRIQSELTIVQLIIEKS